MAFLIGTHGEDEDLLSDINITPLVDVMLVLLIIFMITAPMLHQGIEVALPKSEAPNLPTRVDEPLILSINREGMVYVKEQPVHPTRLVQVLTPMLRGREDQTVFLKGDRDVPYGRVIEVLDLLHKGGIERVGMVTDRPDEPTRR
jgi:biopolymer transport protein TolR